MNKKGYNWKNIIGFILFALVVVFLVLLTKNKGNFSGVWLDIKSIFGK